MNEGCFNLHLRVVNTEAVILVKILLDATFSGYPMTESFLRERMHSENLYELHW